MAALDQYVAPGLRLWMLIGLVASVLLFMVVIVCCFVRIRIPRTKRQIELIAAQRKLRKAAAHGVSSSGTGMTEHEEQRGQTIVMNSLVRPTHGHSAKRSHNHQTLVSRSIPV